MMGIDVLLQILEAAILHRYFHQSASLFWLLPKDSFYRSLHFEDLKKV
jgi:hypothetical protein